MYHVLNRKELISLIKSQKSLAVKKGFDWPSESIDKGELEDLRIFLQQLTDFFLDKEDIDYYA
jgi:hypothetical protein